MALINCPECGKQVSDRAKVCINCGFPLEEIKDKKVVSDDTQKVIEEVKIERDPNKTYCPKCGNEIQGRLLVCMKCGWRDHDSDIAYERPKQKPDKREEVKSYSSDVVKNYKKKKKHGCCGTIFWLLIIVGGLSSIFSEDDNNHNNQGKSIESKKEIESKNESENHVDLAETTEKEPELSQEEKFLNEMSAYMSNDLAQKTYNILVNDIGFLEVSFIEKMDGLLNYWVYGDGIEIVVTDIGEDVRIFKPNSDYVFYENGSVVTTKADMDAKTIDHYDAITYYIMAQSVVESCLTNPNSADFPSINTHAGDISMQKNGDLIAVRSYVDAKNALGAKVRSYWTVQYTVVDMGSYLCDPNYIKIDNETVGEFINMD